MEMYVILFALLTFYWIVEPKNKTQYPNMVNNNANREKENDILFILLFLLFVVVYAFRGDIVGTDTETYFNMIESRNLHTIEYSIEFLFWLIIDLGTFLGLSPSCCLCFIGALSFGGIMLVIKKYSRMPAVSLFFFLSLGVFVSSFNVMRQFMALSFFLLAVDNLIENRLLNYFVFCALAFFSHNSAIVLVPIFLVKYLKLNWKTILCFILVSISSIFLLPYATKLLSQFTNRNYYDYYIEGGWFSNTISAFNLCYLIGIVVVFCWFYYIRNFIVNLNDKREYDFFLLLFLIFVCIRMIATFCGFFELVNRFTIFFFWSIVILIPYTVRYFPFEKFKVFYRFILYSGGLVYFLISCILRKSSEVVPYKFIFNRGSFNFALVVIIVTILSLSISYICNNMRRQWLNERKYD